MKKNNWLPFFASILLTSILTFCATFSITKTKEFNLDDIAYECGDYLKHGNSNYKSTIVSAEGKNVEKNDNFKTIQNAYYNLSNTLLCKGKYIYSRQEFNSYSDGQDVQYASTPLIHLPTFLVAQLTDGQYKLDGGDYYIKFGYERTSKKTDADTFVYVSDTFAESISPSSIDDVIGKDIILKTFDDSIQKKCTICDIVIPGSKTSDYDWMNELYPGGFVLVYGQYFDNAIFDIKIKLGPGVYGNRKMLKYLTNNFGDKYSYSFSKFDYQQQIYSIDDQLANRFSNYIVSSPNKWAAAIIVLYVLSFALPIVVMIKYPNKIASYIILLFYATLLLAILITTSVTHIYSMINLAILLPYTIYNAINIYLMWKRKDLNEGFSIRKTRKIKDSSPNRYWEIKI